MAKDLNRHECIGRLGADPEIKYAPSGKAITSISIACGNSWTDKQSGQKEERTEWIRYVAFDKLAEIIAEYCRKGSKIWICGELRTRKWTDQQGIERYSTEVIADQMQMLDSKPQEGAAPQARPAAQPRSAPPAQQPPPDFDGFDDDIPFN